MSELPPYAADPPTDFSGPNSVASNQQTCSIKDLQQNYIKVVRESATSYHLCLSSDNTPVFRIEFSKDPSAVGDILILPVSSTSSVALAAARLHSNVKKNEAVASICTSSPHLPDSQWHQLVFKPSLLTFGEDYKTSMPIVKLPGALPTLQSFGWRTTLSQPYFELWWDGPLPLQPPSAYNKSERDFRFIFAACAGENQDTVIEIRRGAGLQFELSVVLEYFAIMHNLKKHLL
jgi:hypothetical protein